MAENDLTGANAPEGATAPAADNVSVQTAATEQEAREARIAAAAARTEGQTEATNEASANDGEHAGSQGDGTEGQTQEDRRRPPKLPDWAQKKFDEVAFEKRQAEREAKQLRDEIERLRAGAKPAGEAAPTQADTQAATEGAPIGGYRTQAEFDAAVQAVADRRLAEQAIAAQAERFNEVCNQTFERGKQAFEDFPDAVQTLRTIGVLTPENVQALLDVADENADKLIYELGSDPDRAARIMSMPMAKRIAELTKLSLAKAAPAAPARKVSNAPPPVRPVEGSARVSSDPRDDDDDRTWFAKREAQRRARMGLA